ncbi:CGNR zinc finger domain-containing protein [Streptomyces sp. G-G2]|uniref:CGNR zinc finger domain-containing protein n=1 Tax=Streptomyces sp. G-G2 TaxID=3046201 RepID=UPI0024BA2D4B|nr:CGNR zinc finger domain-containing protein [Streptomyces sp. G-G2]MDJ0380653.1 CGNR zinc finger domain-containing protein [Streptomyces sp. G-G2]
MSGVRAPAPGGLALVEDLVNTLSVDTGEDRLAAEFGLSGRALAGAVTLRECLRAACRAHAGHAVPPGRLDTLNELLAGVPLLVRIGPDGAARVLPAREPTGESGLTARVADAIARAAADGTWTRLKACEAPDCQWAYYDRSPAGRGRWCVMAVCGSRAKMRTYRAARTA